jgi:hypothetical protein
VAPASAVQFRLPQEQPQEQVLVQEGALQREVASAPDLLAALKHCSEDSLAG